MANAIKPNIYEYKTLSVYLKAFHDYKKQSNPRWSLGLWSQKLGLTGTGTLSNFISARRIPATKTLELIKKSIGLSEYESQYFDALVVVSTKNTNPALQKAAQALLSSKAVGKEYFEMTDDQFKQVSSPLGVLLIEAVKLKNFQKDAQWIKGHLKLLKITEAEIEERLDMLTNLGLLQSDKPHYKTPVDTSSEVLKEYYEECLEINRQAVRNLAREERYLNSITFCCSREKVEALKEAIHEFSKQTLHEYDQEEGDIVFQLHTQLVPHLSV
ncbi:MAG: TIGR02147 family protein [Bacteriovoracaceae bacterium]